ncbi:MAG: DEAD/DEAH box helicase [Ruminococcaceae bacterium]|nr:DEAD/DEAH box helicase [Oscillospiraceae bacterium]
MDFKNINFKWQFRSYQQTVLDNADKHLKDNKIHIVAAPGSGKTILGLELIKRLNSPALILSPSVTIRQQWGERFIEAFLPENEKAEEYISYNLKEPKLLTSITYQALHAAYTKTSTDEEIDDESFESEEIQDFTNFEILDVIKNAKIKTICLDEAHHLKSEWQKALEKFIEALGGTVKIISLTATPPYDSAPNEWAKYSSLCGEIDEEIFVPQLVSQKTLCPHQDYIYFSYPTEEEANTLKNYKEKAKQTTNEIIKSGLPLKAIENSQILENSEESEILLYDNFNNFQELFLVAMYGGKEFDQKILKRIFDGRKDLKCNLINAEKAFQFIIENPEIFTEELSENLKQTLSQNGLIEKKKVRLISNEKINKLIISSSAKLESIKTIVESEYFNLKENLRMLILTDFIKKDLIKIIGTDKKINDMGTVPVFESVRRSTNENCKIALLSGTLVIVPDSALEIIEKISNEENVSFTTKKLENTLHTQINFSGSNKNKVKIITKAFQSGVINVLVGTKSLLGEGWDSPNINSLILASFVGSFMLSNQMRGRAIRIDKNNPDKISNIWHLVTVEPDSDENSENINGDDFETIKRRFNCFQAPAYSEDVIENGIDRIDILKPPFNEKNLKIINQKMLTLASQREQVESQWNNVVKGSNHPEIVEECEISPKIQPTSVILKNKIISCVLAVLILLSVTLGIICGGFLGVLLIAISIVCIYFLYKYSKIVFKNISPEKTVETLSKCIFKSLKEIGEIDSKNAKVYVATRKDSSVSCSLQRASAREKNIFKNAITEMLSPIDDPRYLIVNTKNNKLNYSMSYACPSVLGVNKETAEILKKHLKDTGCNFQLVFTRNQNGRKELFKSKKYSYINLNNSKVKNKRKVN